MIPRVRRRVPLRGPSRGAERLDPLRGQQYVSNFMSVHTTEHLDGFLGLLGVETDLLEEAPGCIVSPPMQNETPAASMEVPLLSSSGRTAGIVRARHRTS